MPKPAYRAYIVENPPEGSDCKARWIEVGAPWPHKTATASISSSRKGSR